jgi:sec-independent protein translocase protein TatC
MNETVIENKEGNLDISSTQTEPQLDLKKDLVGHMIDIRNLLFRTVGTWAFFTAIAGYFYEKLIAIAIQPVGAYTLQFISPTESVSFVLKIVAIAGVFASLPFLIFFFFLYLKDALKSKEVKFLGLYVVAGVFLSYFAFVYGFYLLVPASIQFLVGFEPAGIKTMLSATNYLDFLILLYFGLVVVFQTPIVVFSVIRSGLVKKSFVTSKRKEIYLAILILSAVLTPTPDPFTMFIMAIPIAVLFELSLALSRSKNID